MTLFEISTEATPEQLDQILKNAGLVATINEIAPGKGEEGEAPSRSILEKDLTDKTAEISDLQRTSKHALESIKSFQQHQEKLYDEFAILRRKYDEIKTNYTDNLWEHCVPYHPELKNIPALVPDLEETDKVIGTYSLGETLGEGQYATVKTCWKKDGDNLATHERAIKMIKKDRIASFSALKRMSNEIGSLRLLRNNKYVVHMTGCLQSTTHLYIFAEVGGPDLFEFFDEHPTGVPESWALSIMDKLCKAVLEVQMMNIAHRDLKPENILLEFDFDISQCTDLKLCDFGLCAKIDGNPLTDFCGSPGFFAPEMLTHSFYHGEKADVWSLGCILLEMVLGHEKFCDFWMVAYDYEVLQDPLGFKGIISDTVESLPDVLKFSDNLNSFILNMLKIDPKDRLSIREVWESPWLKAMKSNSPSSPLSRAASSSRAASPRADSDVECMTHDPPTSARGGSLPLSLDVSRQQPRANSLTNQSARERKLLEDFNVTQGQGGGGESKGESGKEIRLPPIEPPTPNIKGARKILQKGAKLVKNADTGFQDPISDSPFGSPSPSGGSESMSTFEEKEGM